MRPQRWQPFTAYDAEREQRERTEHDACEHDLCRGHALERDLDEQEAASPDAGEHSDPGERTASHRSSLDSRRSASGLPPVWQVGQYCSDVSAKETSRTVSPQTGQGRPVRACTCSPERFSPFSVAAFCPRWRSTASVSVVPHRRVQRISSSSVELVGQLERRQLRGVQDLVGVGVADAGDHASGR